MRRPAGAFTLIELLAVIGILAVLIGVAVPVVGSAQKGAERAEEIAAARQVIGAYLAAAADRDGALLAGYNAAEPATDDQGQPVGNPINARYPWRLAPWLGYDVNVLYGNAGQRVKNDRALDRTAWLYAVSVSPAFGINAVFVGGDYQQLNPENPRLKTAYGAFCVTRLAQATKPSSLVAFASAAFLNGDERVPGYFKVEPPATDTPRWQGGDLSPDARPEATGHVDFRHGGKALAAMLDGHVELLGIEELRDMRRWANPAAEADDAEWHLGK